MIWKFVNCSWKSAKYLLEAKVKLKAIKLEQVRTKVKASKTPEQTHTNINTFFTYIAKL